MPHVLYHDMTVEFSSGTRFKIVSGTSTPVWKQTIAKGSSGYGSVSFDNSGFIVFEGDYFPSDVFFVLVTVRNWSRISEAMWQIDIQH